jgi:hypothetical protein
MKPLAEIFRRLQDKGFVLHYGKKGPVSNLPRTYNFVMEPTVEDPNHWGISILASMNTKRVAKAERDRIRRILLDMLPEGVGKEISNKAGGKSFYGYSVTAIVPTLSFDAKHLSKIDAIEAELGKPKNDVKINAAFRALHDAILGKAP